MKLSWRKLLSSERAEWAGPLSLNRPSDRKPSETAEIRAKDVRTPFEQDYDRIVFSLPFRRLARKTQVHPLASNDHIHNRLTHSIEVASVGRSFAVNLAELATTESDLQPESTAVLPWILQSACLIHDLGNPPFGHAGEEVIRAWAETHQALMFPESRFHSEEARAACIADWTNFEGNAQGFRLAARPDNQIAGYLRLTYATLAASIKYPWLSTDERTAKKRKHSVYTSEAAIFRHLGEELGLCDGNGRVCRHPLSFLTEAADDICYRILDLEDAVEMGICDRPRVQDLFLRMSGNERNDWMPMSQLRGQAISRLMAEYWRVFAADFGDIMVGEREQDLKSSLSAPYLDLLAEVQEIYREIFSHRKKIATELGAYHVLGRVLKSLIKTIQSIDDATGYEEVHFISKRCVELTWGERHARENLHRSYDWWLRQVMDFVSGMTDNYATHLSCQIGGFALDAS